MFKRFIAGAAAASPLALAAPLAQAQQFFRIGHRRHGPGVQRLAGECHRHSRRRAGESGISQADVANWPFTGKGVFESKPNVPGLRLIAKLYPESVHRVVRKGSGIKSVADLKGKRVALDEPGSGTLIDARIIQAASGAGIPFHLGAERFYKEVGLLK